MSIYDLDKAGFTAADAKCRARGYRLRRLNALNTGAGICCAAIWLSRP